MGSPKRTIYVVDPDPATCAELSRSLGALGCTFHCCASAEEFLLEFSADAAACLITELELPGLGGLALVEHIARSGLCLPCIVISGNDNVRDAVTAVRSGATSFVRKPLRKGALLADLRRVLH